MKLNITERVLLLGTMPREGNIVDMNNSQNVRNVASFSTEELDKLQMVQNEAGMQWSAEAANEIGEKDIVVGVSGAEFIKQTLIKLSDEEKLPLDALSLWRKFVDADLQVRDNTGRIVREKVPEILHVDDIVKAEPAEEFDKDSTNVEDLNQRTGGPPFPVKE